MTSNLGPTGSEQSADRDAESKHIASRAELLPEEKAAESDDPEGQAEAILAESEERTLDPEGTRRASTQTPGGV